MRWYRTISFRFAVSVLVFWFTIFFMFWPHEWWQDYWWETANPVMRYFGNAATTRSLYMLGYAVEFTGPLVLALLVFHGMGDDRRAEGWTRCGKCAHILKGLTEPRCPKCGEVI